MGGERVFNREGREVYSAGDDDVIKAAQHLEAPIDFPAVIGSVKPASLAFGSEDFGCELGLAQIPFGEHWPGQVDAAICSQFPLGAGEWGTVVDAAAGGFRHSVGVDDVDIPLRSRGRHGAGQSCSADQNGGKAGQRVASGVVLK